MRNLLVVDSRRQAPSSRSPVVRRRARSPWRPGSRRPGSGRPIPCRRDSRIEIRFVERLKIVHAEGRCSGGPCPRRHPGSVRACPNTDAHDRLDAGRGEFVDQVVVVADVGAVVQEGDPFDAHALGFGDEAVDARRATAWWSGSSACRGRCPGRVRDSCRVPSRRRPGSDRTGGRLGFGHGRQARAGVLDANGRTARRRRHGSRARRGGCGRLAGTWPAAGQARLAASSG